MKNKKVFKYIAINFFQVIISLILGISIVMFLYYMTMFVYDTFNLPLFNKIIETFLYIKNQFIGDRIYYIAVFIICFLIYSKITYKKYKGVVTLYESVDEMAKGNLHKKIEIKTKGSIKQVSENINNIVEQLKNITVEERKAQQTKTDLITNVSHDLRTPLTSILGYLNLIEEGKYKDEVELMYYVDIAYEKSQNLNILINDLFELTKMQNGSVNFNKINLNLVELISQLVSQFDIQFRQAQMECRVNFSIDKLMINGDGIKLVRAFENLLTNAIRYGSEGKYIDINVSKDENMSIVQVINYGEPIPLVDLPHIFDRFYRVEKSRNKVNGGSGLGLAITKNIIEAHDGKIEVTSENNKTVFQVEIPYLKN